MTPIEASSRDNEAVVFRILNKPLLIESDIKFKVGNSVRMSRLKVLFQKRFLPYWSEEIFTADQIKNTIPVTYILRDTSEEVIAGSFYNEELQKTDKEVYRIENFN